MSRILGPGSLSIGEPGSPRQFGGDTTKTTITPSTDSEDDTPMLDGSNESGADTTTWELGGTVMDSYTMDSLFVWAAENAGKELPFVFTPTEEGELTIGGVVKVRPFAAGGDVKKKNTNDFAFPLVGDPTFSAS
ncbi:MAG: hypothetical protein ACTJGT_01735 [Microbacteriaceae bacterium]